MRKPVVLIIAGVDSSGGAGLCADILAGQENGVSLRLAVTAVTAQTDRAVGGREAVAAALVLRQIAMALEDGAVAAVKIGMLGTAAVTLAVAEALADHAGAVPIVLDPVLASSSGASLLDEEALPVFFERLVPHARLLTPNLPELDRLSGWLGIVNGDAEVRGRALLSAGAEAVLVKGGHAGGERSDDLLLQAGVEGPVILSAPRIAAVLRGTGCRLSTAIAARLAHGDTVEAACRAAKAQLTALLAEVASGRAD